ncbi:hypothetical protein [Actinomadura rubrobrunea]|nr:hypothetical protein [Actinomadura rubrobrunea]
MTSPATARSGPGTVRRRPGGGARACPFVGSPGASAPSGAARGP